MMTVVKLLILCSIFTIVLAKEKTKVLVLTSGQNSKDGFWRLQQSANAFSLNLQNFNEETKYDSLMKTLRSNKDAIVLYLGDPENTILAGNKSRIAERFRSLKADVVIPKDSKQNPSQTPSGCMSDLLTSGASLVGSALKVLEILEAKKTESRTAKGDECPAVRVKVDKDCLIFQVIPSQDGLKMLIGKTRVMLENTASKTIPAVVLAKRDDLKSRSMLNHYGNFISNAWNRERQCQHCKMDTIKFEDLPKVPTILLSVFIRQPTVFFPEFLESLKNLDYPKSKLDLLVHNQEELHVEEINEFLEKVKQKYKSVTVYQPKDQKEEYLIRNQLGAECREKQCDYVLVLDTSARLDNPKSLQWLIEQNRHIVAPMLSNPGTEIAFGNFMGKFEKDGDFDVIEDDFKIMDKTRIGLWNMPCVTGAYLIKRKVFEDSDLKPDFNIKFYGVDNSFCQSLLEKGVFMYVSNRHDFGHLVDLSHFNHSCLHQELWHLTKNRIDYERRYLHEDFPQNLNMSVPVHEPCPDVFWVPMVTEKFADHMVEEMEHYGQWSGGDHQDSRLKTGYENYPTRDIHLTQIGLQEVMIKFLEFYVAPIVKRVFTGYQNKTPRPNMMFVIRYKPDEQPSLSPHFDSSLYSINIALNHAGKDYTGGGCGFIRQNCSVTDTKKGWMMIHPGKLTHYHEGLPVTSGTRYILVSFVNS